MADLEPIVGRYVRMTLAGRPHRVYFEEAGEGVPLVCLHTAGADGRQFRHLLNDLEITRHFRVIALDLPWHGKSLPPAGWQDEEYTLTTRGYVDLVRAFWRFFEQPRRGEVYNIGGGRYANCSMLEAIAMIEEMTGRRLDWTYSDTNPIGDHIWWISDIRKFMEHYPGWRIEYDLRRTVQEMIEAQVARAS